MTFCARHKDVEMKDGGTVFKEFLVEDIMEKLNNYSDTVQSIWQDRVILTALWKEGRVDSNPGGRGGSEQGREAF